MVGASAFAMRASPRMDAPDSASSIDLNEFRRVRDRKLKGSPPQTLLDCRTNGKLPPRPGLDRGAAVGGGCGRFLRPANIRSRRIVWEAARMGLFDSVGAWFDEALNGDECLSPEAAAAIDALCRADGWSCKCEIGSSVARSVGGSGSLATGPTTSTAVLNLRLGFALDEGYAPPQGGCSLLKPSKFLSADQPTRGFWKVDDDGDDGFPRQVQWRLNTKEADGLTMAGGDVLLPPGAVYFNAKCASRADGAGITLGDGRITIKEDLGANVGIFQV